MSDHMTRWQDFVDDQPDFAARAQAALLRGRHLTMATLRADGSPRISGTEIELSEGDLYIGSMENARKARDLQCDPRVAIHGGTEDPPENPTEWSGEAKIAGRAIEVPQDDPTHRFRIDIDEVVFTHLNDEGNRLVVESWHPGRGVEVVERE